MIMELVRKRRPPMPTEDDGHSPTYHLSLWIAYADDLEATVEAYMCEAAGQRARAEAATERAEAAERMIKEISSAVDLLAGINRRLKDEPGDT